MTLTSIRRAAIAIAALFTVSAMPAAALTYVGGFGAWDSTTAVTAHSAPDTIFSFFFSLPDTFLDESPASGLTTTTATLIGFQLDGVDVLEPIDSVTFYASGDGGLFDLVFASQTIEFFGEDIGSTGVLKTGFYLADIDLAGDTDSTGSALVITQGIPEPATWSLLLGGFAMTGVALRRRERVTA